MRVLLLRHAESTWNQQLRWQGWADPPLTADGRQAALAWSAHPPAAFDVVVSSDLIRARDTAVIIAGALHLVPVQLCRGLREQDQGAWTGLTKPEIKRRWPERLRERPRCPVDGETALQVLDRARACLDGLSARAAECILAFTHTGVIREVERELGCDPCPVPHLEGRWVELTTRVLGDDAPEWAPGEPTAGRAQRAGHPG
jgi:broad specificity phosphatase PhoE